ncbi:MAG TPA: dihydrolipoamide dehydrogenase [Actinobacteria bacterium]|nr:dihydrolipoamide dehydrogenase [Actinomycetota bacterium]
MATRRIGSVHHVLLGDLAVRQARSGFDPLPADLLRGRSLGVVCEQHRECADTLGRRLRRRDRRDRRRRGHPRSAAPSSQRDRIVTESADVDTIVIGGGMAGLPFALRAARRGSTVLIEGDLLGGTCLNRGCIPTKTMIHSAKVAHVARRAGEFGIDVGSVSVDLGRIVDRKDAIVEAVRNGSYRAAERATNLTLVENWARFVGPHAVEAGGAVYRAARIVINTGARPTVPDLPGIGEVPILDSTSALDLREVPEHLIVMGGGYVGCEFAQMYRRFGSQVTVVHRRSCLLPAEDPEASEVIERVFAREGIELLLGEEPTAVRAANGRIDLSVGGRDVEASHLLLAVGRTPNTSRLGLEIPGVAVDERGFIVASERFETSAAGIHAIGDVIGPPLFTHSARDDAALLARHLFKGEDITTSTRLVPHAVFTDPEVATFGMTAGEAETRYGESVVGVENFRGVARAKAIGETDGFVKIVTRPDRVIVGATIVGPDAGNLIHELVVAAYAELTVDRVRNAIHIHPTLAEAVNAAAGGVHRPTTA